MNKEIKSATTITGPAFQTKAIIREFTFGMDETEDVGGANTAAKPTEVVLAALCACTAITLKVYAKRKEADLGEVRVDADLEVKDGKNYIYRKVSCYGNVPSEVRDRLAHIANLCPVHKMLAGNAEIKTEINFF